jgi:hypothetical protein
VFYTCSCQQTTDAQHEHKKKTKKIIRLLMLSCCNLMVMKA